MKPRTTHPFPVPRSPTRLYCVCPHRCSHPQPQPQLSPQPPAKSADDVYYECCLDNLSSEACARGQAPNVEAQSLYRLLIGTATNLNNLVLVQFGVHILRHRSDCDYLDVLRAFRFHHDDNGGAALSKAIDLEIFVACVSDDRQLR